MKNTQLNIDTSQIDFLLQEESLDGVILATHEVGSDSFVAAFSTVCGFC